MRQKRNLDGTDLEIVELLVADARRPFRDIADRVDLSPPAVSDRVDRLREQGVIRRFTVDLDRTKLRGGTPVVVEFRADPAHVDEVYESVRGLEGVEHAFLTHDGTVLAHANAPGSDLGEWLRAGLELSLIADYEISLLDRHSWNPDPRGTDFAIACVVCGNEVTEDGVTVEIDGETKAFCCPSCRDEYEERYETLGGTPD